MGQFPQPMIQLLRIVNAFAAALFLVTALVSIAFLSAGRDGFAGGPATPWMPAGWAALFALLALLSFVNLRRALADEGRRALALVNFAAALPLLAGAVALEGAARLLCCASALPFALTAGMLAARRPL